MSGPVNGFVTFVEYDIPALQPGAYEITVDQNVEISGEAVSPGVASANVKFAVKGERFVLNNSDIYSVFPQDLASGEFSQILPHVIFNRRTLPWERSSIPGKDNVTWLAVLLFNENESPPTPQNLTAQALVGKTQLMSIYDSKGDRTTTTSYGTLPDSTYFSYPGINNLDYGEAVDTPCSIIDIPIDTFNKIAPAQEDLPYLAHYRTISTTNAPDIDQGSLEYAIVVSNRVSASNTNSYAYLVSLEGMGPYLPSSDGSSSLPAGTHTVRLIVYYHWKFFANSLDETLETLLENLVPQTGQSGVSSLQYPIDQSAPTSAQVETALQDQQGGKLSQADANILVLNALNMGYVPLGHHLRYGEETFSWYRGPLVPYAVAQTCSFPVLGADALYQYNPQTGLFDVSYSMAWQLGQLLALQNQNFATALYNWKKTVQDSEILAEEEALLDQQLIQESNSFFGSVFQKRKNLLTAPAVPEEITDWIAKLMLLNGVPFNYLVPDEKMLPPESMRFFYLDLNWVDALVDGAFSIGRTSAMKMSREIPYQSQMKKVAAQKMRTLRKNNPSENLKTVPTAQVISGFLMRSKAVTGWPGLNVKGYSDMNPDSQCLLYKMIRLSSDTLICFFEGDVVKVDIHEPPEQLHFGVEGSPGSFTTSLRVATANSYPKPPEQPLPLGMQFPPSTPPIASPSIPVRSDDQTIQIASAASNILSVLNNSYNQNLASFTSAEFALEMVKGVVQVEFQKTTNS